MTNEKERKKERERERERGMQFLVALRMRILPVVHETANFR